LKNHVTNHQTARTGTLVFIFALLRKLYQLNQMIVHSNITYRNNMCKLIGTLFNATSSGIAGSCAGTKYDVWYTFTTPAGCTSVSIDMADIPAGGSNLSTGTTFMEAF
jgi:hypothetical protein